MVLPIAALMIGMGVKRKIEQDKLDDAAAAEDLAAKREDRAYMVGQRQRGLRQQEEADALQASMKAAATPARVDPNMVPDPTTDNRDVGLPGTAPAAQQGFRVNGQVLPDQAAADAAVTAYNDPDATMARMSGALTAAGKPIEAMDLNNKAAQAKVTKLQLDEAQRTALNRMYDDDLNKKATSFDALAEFLSNSRGDGQGGAVKAKAVVSPDGKKVTMNRVNPDGTLTPTEHTFDNTPAGLARAKALLSQAITPEAKLTHLHQQVQEEQAAAELAERVRNNKEQNRLTEKGLDNTARHQRVMEANSARAAAAAEKANAPKPVTPESTFDAKLARDMAEGVVKKEAEERALAQKPMTGAEIAKRVDEITSSMFAQHQNRFVATQVQRELGMAQSDPALYATTYAKALKVMPQAELARLGFNPPAAPGARPTVADPAIRNAQPGSWQRPGAEPTAAPGAAAPAATVAPAVGDPVLQGIERGNRAALDGMAQQLFNAREQLKVLAKSGDPKALATQAAAVQQASDNLKAEAAKRLGNGAPAYLANIL